MLGALPSPVALLRWLEVTLFYGGGVPGANWRSLDPDCVWFLSRLGPSVTCALWKESGGTAGWGGFLVVVVVFAYLCFLKMTAVPFTSYKRKACAKVPISLRHTVSSELGGGGRPRAAWWGSVRMLFNCVAPSPPPCSHPGTVRCCGRTQVLGSHRPQGA